MFGWIKKFFSKDTVINFIQSNAFNVDDEDYKTFLDSIAAKYKKDEIFPSAGSYHNELSMGELIKKSNHSIKWVTDKFQPYNTPYIRDVLNNAIIDRNVSVDIVFATGRPDLNTNELYKLLATHQDSHKKIRFTDVSEKLKERINKDNGLLITFAVVDDIMFFYTKDTENSLTYFSFDRVESATSLKNIIDKEFIV